MESHITTERIKGAILNIIQPLSEMGYLTTEGYMATLTALPSMKNGVVAAFALTSILQESSLSAQSTVQTEAARDQTPSTIQSSMGAVLAASYVLNVMSTAMNKLLKEEEADAPLRREGCELEGGFDIHRLKDFAKLLDAKSKDASKLLEKLEKENEKMQKAVVERLQNSKGNAEKLALEFMKGQQWGAQQPSQLPTF